MALIKKIIFILPLATVLLSFFLQGCNSKNDITIDTVLQMDKYFSGARTITCTFPTNTIPLGSESENLLDKLIESNCPPDIAYKKSADSSYINYIFTINFSSKEEYRNKLNKIMKTNPTIILSESNTIFTNGCTAYEDFNSLDILSFITKAISKEANLKNIKSSFKFNSTKVIFNEKVYNTGPKIKFNDIVEYNPINSITIKTNNTASNVYDRTIILSIPISTYNKLGNSILSYINSRIDNRCVYKSEWFEHDDSIDFKISYTSLNIDQLKKVTAMFLNSASNENVAYYNDDENTSIFKDQQIFEEHIDTSAYLSKNAENIPVTYIYESDNNIDSGLIHNEFNWENCGNILNNTFSVTSNNLTLGLKIIEKEDFIPRSIDIDMVAEDDGNFTRNIELYYPKDNINLFNRTLKRLNNIENIKISSAETSDKYICYISMYGNIETLNNSITKIFSNDSYLSYEIKENKFMAYNNTILKDNIRLKNILPENISSIPIKYTINENKKMDIAKLTYKTFNYIEDVDLNQYTSGMHDEILLYLDVADVDIEYYASNPNINGIIFIITLVILYFISIFSIVLYVNYKTNIKLSNAKSGKYIHQNKLSDCDIDDLLSNI